MSKTTVNELKRLIGELSAKRQEYVEAIAEIDHTFATLGIRDNEAVSTGTGKKRGRKPGSKNKTAAASATTTAVKTTGAKRGPKPGSKNKKTAAAGAKRGPKPGSKRGKRGSFGVSGEQFVLDFVKSAGSPNAKEVNAHWTGEGRAGKADNALSKLVKLGSLKRVNKPGERGSRYAAA